MWTSYDAITTPGESTELWVRHEVRVLGTMRFPVRGSRIKLTFSGETHLGTTQKGGFAPIRINAPREPGSWTVKVGEGDSASGLLFAISPEHSILVTDLDRTVSDATAWGFWLKSLGSIRPYAQAREVLQEVSKTHLIVYLTARSDLLLGKTRVWLRRNEFPPGPVFCRHRQSPGKDAESFKTETLKDLKYRFPRIRFGIGDKEMDVRSYRANDIPAIHFRSGDPPPSADEVKGCGSWSEIGGHLKESLGG
jgi:hypothetical protein